MDPADMSNSYSVTLKHATFNWTFDQGQFTFFGLPSVLFWSNPSLLRMLAPLADEVGFPLFRLLIATQSSLGTDEDYHAMVTVLGSTFEAGFLAWGQAVSTAGWGVFELPQYDPIAKRATVIVRNPWELVMQTGQASNWGCPFLQGKLIGIFSHALATNCWADEQIIADAPLPTMQFEIYPSTLVLAEELQYLRNERRTLEQAQLSQEVARKAQELQSVQAEALRAQAALIAELSTPLIPIHRQIVLMPLIGQMDTSRAQRILETLLEGVAANQATFAILDITGLPLIDISVAHTLLQAAQALKLLGTESIITGIHPDVAQTLIALDIDLGTVITRATVQSGIAYAMNQIAKRS